MSSFKYQNPIASGIQDGIRDSQVLSHNGKWYMTGTSSGFWEGEDNPGVVLYSSENLKDWKKEALLIDRSKLDPSVWYYDRFWAPELHCIKGRWYLSFNCRNESEKYKHRPGCGIAVADEISGPYTVVTEKEPIAYGNDFHFYHEDGRTYAFWNSLYIFCAEIDLEKMTLLEEPRKLFSKSSDPADWDYIGIEGSWCMKREGKYYLFYSSWTRGYEIGYASADSIYGPWTKYGKNPVYGEIDPYLCAKHGVVEPPPHDPESPFIQAGHNAVFKGPDGRDWLSCHGITKGGIPLLCIDPLKFDEDGRILYSGPTYRQETVSL